MFPKILKIFLYLFPLLFIEVNTVFGYNPIAEGKAPIYNPYSEVKFCTSSQSNLSLDFYEFFSGINSVYVITPKEISHMLFNDQQFYSKYRVLLKEYLLAIGLQNVAISSDEQNELDSSVSLRQTATFELKLDFTDNYFSKVSFSFFSCNKDEFRFSKNVNYYIDEKWDEFLFSTFKTMFWHSILFNPANSYKLNSVTTKWNESSITEYLQSGSNDKLEGIYEKFGTDEQYRIGFIKEGDTYKIIYLSGAKNKFDWYEGDFKGIARKTSINNFYKVEWILSDKTTNREVYLSTSEEYFLNFEFLDPQIASRSKYIKMLPVFSANQSVTPSTFSSSGTGFAVSNEGLVITNYHVVENGKSISVKFNDGKNSNSYKAEIVAEDKENDLAILSIKDQNFISFEHIPYKISNQECDIGINVFTLGYPLIQTMGSSIKLANGIISSQTGFLDNKQFYQVTIPINPGNSGGPLFDDSGNIVGIINAKHSAAENVAYALKSPFLKNGIIKLYSQNVGEKNQSSQQKSLPELVKTLQKFVCLIKVD